MPKKKAKDTNRSQLIRDQLKRNIDASAQTIASKLQNDGVDCDPQHVYLVRSALKRKRGEAEQARLKTRAINQAPLGKYICSALEGYTCGVKLLAEAVKAAGYVTHSKDFQTVVLQKLYDLQKAGAVVKIASPEGTVYSLTSAGSLAAKNADPAAKASVDLVTSNGDYELLKRAVVHYARLNNLDNPEQFPDRIVALQTEIDRLQTEIDRLNKSW